MARNKHAIETAWRDGSTPSVRMMDVKASVTHDAHDTTPSPAHPRSGFSQRSAWVLARNRIGFAMREQRFPKDRAVI